MNYFCMLKKNKKPTKTRKKTNKKPKKNQQKTKKKPTKNQQTNICLLVFNNKKN